MAEAEKMSARQARSIAALIMLICLPAMGQEEEEDRSYGRPNGRFYLKRDDQARIDLLYGIEQGISLLVDEEAISKETMDRYTLKGFRFGDLKEQVDKLYQDKANIRIPISYAYVYAIRRARGDSPYEIDNFLAQLRKRFLKR
jgi:hypothetical protein